MQRETIYEVWIPPHGAWSLWARPVLFAEMPDDEDEAATPDRFWPAVDVSWAPDAAQNVLLLIDLPGEESVHAGLELAGRGYRPVPAFNACTDAREVVPQRPIQRALRLGAPYLQSLSLPPVAPPAFLLDASRMAPGEYVRPGQFDNRWQVFPQDFPSAAALRERDVGRVLVVQRGSRVPADDVADVLRDWQDAGLDVWAKGLIDASPPAPIRIASPPWYRALWHGVLAALGLRRAPPGGFGRLVPEPQRSQG